MSSTAGTSIMMTLQVLRRVIPPTLPASLFTNQRANIFTPAKQQLVLLPEQPVQVLQLLGPYRELLHGYKPSHVNPLFSRLFSLDTGQGGFDLEFLLSHEQLSFFRQLPGNFLLQGICRVFAGFWHKEHKKK